jgi:hypothetical protein
MLASRLQLTTSSIRRDGPPPRPVSRLLRTAGALALAGLTSCGTGAYLEVRQTSETGTYRGVEKISFRPIEYVDLIVDGDPEADYVADLDAEERYDWQRDKQRIEEIFVEVARLAAGEEIEIVEGDAEAPFEVRPVIGEIETGYYRIPAWNAVTRILMTVEILDRKGQVRDVLELGDGAAFDALANPTVGGRLGSVAKSLGRMVGEYLRERSRE